MTPPWPTDEELRQAKIAECEAAKNLPDSGLPRIWTRERWIQIMDKQIAALNDPVYLQKQRAQNAKRERQRLALARTPNDLPMDVREAFADQQIRFEDQVTEMAATLEKNRALDDELQEDRMSACRIPQKHRPALRGLKRVLHDAPAGNRPKKYPSMNWAIDKYELGCSNETLLSHYEKVFGEWDAEN